MRSVVISARGEQRVREGHPWINLRALRVLSPGGYLVTCSCSYNVSESMFKETLHEPSIDSHTPVTIVERRMQGAIIPSWSASPRRTT